MDQRGHPHQRGQTPHDYERDVRNVLPDAHSDLATLTAGYVQARYAARPPEPSLAAAVRSAWERIQTLVAPPPQ
jgi:hypothetical protein